MPLHSLIKVSLPVCLHYTVIFIYFLSLSFPLFFLSVFLFWLFPYTFSGFDLILFFITVFIFLLLPECIKFYFFNLLIIVKKKS